MRIFLTGGTGFIGQPLTKSLLERGYSVTALVRKPDSPQAQALSKMGTQLATGDVTERESMRAAMSNAEVVVHNAGHYELGLDSAGKQRMRLVNANGTENVLSLAYELNIPRTIYVSTVAAYGDSGCQPCDETFKRQSPSVSTYEQTKMEAHEIACQYQKKGLPLIIVCPNGVVGVNDHSHFGYLVRLYINHLLPPIAWSPHSIFCLVELHDLAEGIALVAEKGRIGETYFLCGDPQSLRELFNYWSKKPGRFGPRIWLPAGLMAALVAPLEPLERKLGLPAFLSRETVRTGATNLYFCSDKAENELGWTHCSAETLWDSTFDGEYKLLSRRKGQNLVQRLKPLEIVE